MRSINAIIVHCSATREGSHHTVSEIRQWHQKRGWSNIGYHYVIYLDGTIVEGRPLHRIGAHAKGYNTGTIGVCYIGGVARDGITPKDTRTPEQKAALTRLIKNLTNKYDIEDIYGHRKVSNKACPSFDAEKEYAKYIKNKGKKNDMDSDKVLRFGDKGHEVIKWTRNLQEIGHAIETTDVFDKRVEEVTRWFQRSRNIVVDGEVGSQSQEEMTRALSGLTPEYNPPKNGKPLVKSRTVAGGVVATGGGIAVMLEPIKQFTDTITAQQGNLSDGNITGLIVGSLIIAGAAYALYARWDDAGRPSPFKGSEDAV